MLSSLHDKHETVHDTCKKARFVAQQRNGLSVVGCSVHFNTPQYNVLKSPAAFIPCTAAKCVQGIESLSHFNQWVEYFCDPRRELLMKHNVL